MTFRLGLLIFLDALTVFCACMSLYYARKALFAGRQAAENMRICKERLNELRRLPAAGPESTEQSPAQPTATKDH